MKKIKLKKGIVLTALALTALSFMTQELRSEPLAPVQDKPAKNDVKLGYTLDLLPVLMSAVSGRAGFSFQTWLGVDHFRLRLVGANMRLPEFLEDNKDFKNHDLTVGALIVDYMFRDDFTGWWIGNGYELWQNRITEKSSDNRVEWTNQVFTVGGGYVCKFCGNAFIEPWGAVHLIMNNRTVSLGNNDYKPSLFSAEVSLKVGYYFD